MTTNTFESLDVAIESRIHIHLVFNSLTQSQREQIWIRFLDRTSRLETSHTLIQPDYHRLAGWDLNGRQIKNIFRMALAVSRHKKTAVSLETLERIIPMSCPKARKAGHGNIASDQLAPTPAFQVSTSEKRNELTASLVGGAPRDLVAPGAEDLMAIHNASRATSRETSEKGGQSFSGKTPESRPLIKEKPKKLQGFTPLGTETEYGVSPG